MMLIFITLFMGSFAGKFEICCEILGRLYEFAALSICRNFMARAEIVILRLKPPEEKLNDYKVKREM